MSFGNYPGNSGLSISDGIWDGEKKPLDIQLIAEDVSHSWYSNSKGVAVPEQGETIPNIDKKDAYSWAKAPRFEGRVMEVGALARMVISDNPLIKNEYQLSGGNVQIRVIARMLELAQTVLSMEKWIASITPGQPFCRSLAKPTDGYGVGMIEAARGSLGHWVRLRDGKIENYQVIAPTTWNFSPRDQDGQPGILESALSGTALTKPSADAVEIQHIVRSFDPCMSCTVH